LICSRPCACTGTKSSDTDEDDDDFDMFICTTGMRFLFSSYTLLGPVSRLSVQIGIVKHEYSLLFVMHFCYSDDLQYNMKYMYLLHTYVVFQYRGVSLFGRLSPNILRDEIIGENSIFYHVRVKTYPK